MIPSFMINWHPWIRLSYWTWEGENAEASAVLLSAPHVVLAMSATPIPGTLALAMHGDMSITQVSNGIRESFYGNSVYSSLCKNAKFL